MNDFEKLIREELCSLTCELNGEWFSVNATEDDRVRLIQQVTAHQSLVDDIEELKSKHEQFRKEIVSRRKALFNLPTYIRGW